jgi:alcohol dehydrogenase
LEILDGIKVESVLFDQVEPNPTEDTIREGAALARSSRVRWILGLGGGSAIDSAKCIALTAVNQGNIRQFADGMLPENDPFPVVAIPTTSGSGSEITPYAEVTDVQQVDKYKIKLSVLFPRLAILDPSLTLTMPETVTVNTGLDALCHAIEAFYSIQRSPATDLLAKDAMVRIVENLPLVRKQADNLQVRMEMQLAAAQAGAIVANTDTLLPHTMSRPITVRYDLPRGRATALLMPGFLERMKEIEPQKTEILGKVLNFEEDLPAGFRKYVESLGVAPSLSAYGMNDSEIDSFTKKVVGRNGLSNTPGDWSRDDLSELYRASL